VSDTIYALSSGTPPAAVAVVRISGPRADAALEALAGTLPEPRHASLVTLRREGEMLDRALALRFPGPGSATGEDVAELHLHGGRAVVAAVTAALAGLPGLRAAEPGEFTRRAFENGRIDLAEAEGLADLLAAETQSQRRAALAMAGGALSREVEAWQALILRAAAALEVALDFSDDEAVDDRMWREPLAEAELAVQAALARAPAERLRDGVKVAIAGPPNSGKSSLLNALVQREAAITSEIAGTTRDLIEVPVAIAGTPFVLIDTAGLRETGDAIESIGVARARAALASADLVLWLGKPEAAPSDAIRVHAKADIDRDATGADISVSAVTGAGLHQLAMLLVERSERLLPAEGDAAVNERQRKLLRECRDLLGQAGAAEDELVAAECLRQARLALDRITGRAGVEDMLDALFGRFCIGK
jgi:tRNA modification GTPase